MEAAAAVSSSAVAGLNRSSSRRSPSSLSRTPLHHRPPMGSSNLVIVAVANSHRGPKGSDGSRRHPGRRASPVDEFMPLLHARIRKLEAAEKVARGSQETTALVPDLACQPLAETDGWAEWETRYYLTGAYHRDVFRAVGVLQCLLMDARPGVAVGALAVVLLGLVMDGITVSASLANALADTIGCFLFL